MTELSKLMREQDNRATENPIFAVQVKVRDYGFETQFEGGVTWIDTTEYDEADEEYCKVLDRYYRMYDEEPRSWRRVGYRDRWEFVTACFTEQGCKDYIKANGHNHRGEKRIFAYGGWRNYEWQDVRKHLLSFTEAQS